MPERVDWLVVVARAAELVSADPMGMTLRGLFDALVAEGRLRNTRSQYVGLSRETGRARREGRFPALARDDRSAPPATWSAAASPLANRLTDQQAEWLGPALVEWGDANADAVAETRAAMRAAGWWARGHTAVLVAVAQRARDELAAEANRVSPSLRAVYYRLVALFGMAKTLQSYQLLVSACTTARERGVMDRRAFVDSKTPDMTTPGDWSVIDALRHALGEVGRPTDAFVGTGLVVGVVCEARGMAPALAGAITSRLGFPLPVWGTAGQVSIPFGAAAEDAMRAWAMEADADALMIVITDYDPAGLIIANNVGRRIDGVAVQRLGVWPEQAERFGAPTAEGIEELLRRPESDDDTNPQERARIWKDAVSRHGPVKVQAEALGPAAWAELVGEAIDRLLANRSGDAITVADLARSLRERRATFDPADDLMAKLYEAFVDVKDDDDPVAALTTRLGLDATD